MRRRFIALQPDSGQWRYAVAVDDQQQATLLQTGTFEQKPDIPLAEQLAALIGPLQFQDRLACALPARNAMVRWLDFPFSEPQKIAAAARLEMSRQLPGSCDGLINYQQQLGENRVLALAVNKEPLQSLIDQFDDNREPLGFIGLAPFCYAAGLEWEEDALLLAAEQGEITLARCEDGKLTDLRILPQTTGTEADIILRHLQLLAHGKSAPLTRLRLLGIDADSELGNTLRAAGFTIDVVQLVTNSGPVAAEAHRVASLALAATKATGKALNLRSGEYKLKNDWQALKRRMWLAAGLLITILLTVIGNGYLQYQQRAAKLNQLEQQLTAVYQQEFPGERLLVPAPLQLQSKLKELQEKSSQFGTGGPGALELLLAISKRIDPKLSVDIKEYLYNDDGLRLSGTTVDFDTVSRLLTNLQQDKNFADVRILDSKQALDGSKVDFQLQIQLRQGEGVR